MVRKQILKCQEIQNAGRRVSVAIDGQCGSTGNNAWRCTVSSTDFQTNSVLHFRVVDVFVSNDVLTVFSLRTYSRKKLH